MIFFIHRTDVDTLIEVCIVQCGTISEYFKISITMIMHTAIK